MINPKTLSPAKLVYLLLPQIWQHQCEIIMQAASIPGGRPFCLVRHGLQYLHYSRGPHQGYYWGTEADADDFNSPELAVVALARAPAPHHALVGEIGPNGPPRDAYTDAQQPLARSAAS